MNRSVFGVTATCRRFRCHSVSLLSSSEQPWETSEYLHRLSDELETFWMLHDDLDGSVVNGCVCFQSFKLAFWFSSLCGLVHSSSTVYFLTSTWFRTNKRWTETLSTTGPAWAVMQIPMYTTLKTSCLRFGMPLNLWCMFIFCLPGEPRMKFSLTQGCVWMLKEKMSLTIERS